MSLSGIIDRFLAHPLVYRLHSAGVDRAKRAALEKFRRDYTGLKVLDLGCGTGNNTRLFEGADYTGVDINRRYILLNRKKFPGCRFLAGDAGGIDWGDDYDVILINSFFHHLPDDQAERIIKKAVASLCEKGVIVVQEPLIPESGEWYHRLMTRLDRGNYFRNFAHWKNLFSRAGLYAEDLRFYSLRILGLRGYHMVSMIFKKKIIRRRA